MATATARIAALEAAVAALTEQVAIARRQAQAASKRTARVAEATGHTEALTSYAGYSPEAQAKIAESLARRAADKAAHEARLAAAH